MSTKKIAYLASAILLLWPPLAKSQQLNPRDCLPGDTIQVGPAGVLPGGNWMQSANGRFYLGMQGDGNLVWSRLLPGAIAGENLWNSGTPGHPGSWVQIQPDGNFVTYENTNGIVKSLWASNTAGNPGAYVKLVDDGNLIVYSSSGEPLWGAIFGPLGNQNRPIVATISKERMDLTVKVSRSGIVEAHRHAAIQKQSGTYHHAFWFTILDKNDNTIWVSPTETLTMGAVTDWLNRPVNVDESDSATYQIPPEVARKAWSVLGYMEQSTNGGSLVDRIEHASNEFKRVDNAYKTMKDSELVKDGAKVAVAIAAGG